MKAQTSIAVVVLFAQYLDIAKPSIIESILVLLTLFAGILAGASFQKEGE